jgi:hypothetical protein
MANVIGAMNRYLHEVAPVKPSALPDWLKEVEGTSLAENLSGFWLARLSPIEG